jgi:NADPH-dependent 2,4-dienoyl-CoA reductase/sulfur reductase-like enzyme
METSLENVWAAGDVAKIPLNASVSGYASVGHISMAQKMGRVAALNVMGVKQSIANSIPFFWTNVVGVSIRYVGEFTDNKSLNFVN